MTISITVSVNGNYRVPVTVQHGTEPASTEVISGRGLDHPNVRHVPFYHGTGGVVTVTVGPEEEDKGEPAPEPEPEPTPEQPESD